MAMGGLIFFIDARDGTAGGPVGGRMSHEKKKNEHLVSKIEHPVLIFRPYSPGTRPAISGSGRFWPVLTGFAAVLSQNGRI